MYIKDIDYNVYRLKAKCKIGYSVFSIINNNFNDID